MKNTDERRRKNIIIKISFLTIVLFFIEILIGCNSNDSTEPEFDTAKVVGKVSDESISGNKSSYGIQNVSVKLIKMTPTGEGETVSIKEAITDSLGKFILETNLDGVRNLLIKADKDDMEWRGILSTDLKSGIAVYIQPLNLVTTISADLYKSTLLANNSLEYTQIRILMDREVAAEIDSNRGIITDLASAFNKSSDAEKEILLRPEIGGTTSQWEQIISAKIDAQSALDRDLYYAGSESAEKVACQNYLNSIAEAYVDVGMQCVTFSKVLEASIRVFLKDIEGINSRLDFVFIKRSSEIRARVINIAVQTEFQKLGADPSISNKVIFSGEELENNLIDLQSEKEISDEFINYRDQLINYLIRVLGINGNVIPAIEDSITAYKNDLVSEVNNGNEQSAIIDAYINFYENISNLVKQKISAENTDQTAVTNVLTLLNVYY